MNPQKSQASAQADQVTGANCQGQNEASCKRQWLADLVAVAIFLLLSTFYFLTPMSQGLVLGGHDSVAAQGLGQEQRQFRESHDGEVTRWSNAIFSGMPTFQMAPSYSSSNTVTTLSEIYSLGTLKWFPAIGFLFLYLLGFYVLLRTLRIRAWLAIAGSVMWAFSSYFLIIIAAGHLWKVLTLAFIPPTIAGLILCYRGKLLKGMAVTALFTAFQLVSNHLQMTYYFLFVMALLVICFFVSALRERRLKQWLKSTAAVIIAGLLGLSCNLSNLYHTYTYSKETMRGKAELSPLPGSSQAGKATDGLDRDYITAWSYGIDETLTLLIPDYKGGGSASILDHEGVEELEGFDTFYSCAGQAQAAFQEQQFDAYPPGIMQYWGDQPFTVGPVYVGAIVCFLFLLGLFYVKGPVKWALFFATLIGLIFSWGKNTPEVTNFLIDHLPLYSKFRTVSSALVIVEFTMPALAILCLAAIVRRPDLFTFGDWTMKDGGWRKCIGLPVAFVLTGGLCLLMWLTPSAAGDCLSASDARTFAAMTQAGFPADFVGEYRNAVTTMHHAILSASAASSFLQIALVTLVLFFVATMMKQQKEHQTRWAVVLGVAVTLLCLVNLWQIDKRYLNDSSFTDAYDMEASFAKTPADEQILADTTYFRVANLGAGNPFNETSNATSYYHHSIGGYHAAKLHRYQDLIDRRLNAELQNFVTAINENQGDMTLIPGDSIAPCLNMLNTKYFIFGSGSKALAICNTYANGNGWFIDSLSFVKNADEEMAALNHLNTKRAAVADSRFKAQLEGSALDSGRVELTHYDTNELAYRVESARGGVVVFSEIYYPGWTVTIDGKEAELGRVNYVLRALKVPAGKHEVRMEFRPASIRTTEAIAFIALAAILLLLAAALYCQWRGRREK